MSYKTLKAKIEKLIEIAKAGKEKPEYERMRDIFFRPNQFSYTRLFQYSTITSEELEKLNFDYTIFTKNVMLSFFFADCPNLTYVIFNDTSKVTSFSCMFQNDANLESVKTLNFSAIPLRNTNLTNMFKGCTKLKEVRIVPDTLQAKLDFSDAPLLSDESVQSIIDGMKQITSGTVSIAFHSDTSERFTDEQTAQIEAKGWTLL